MRVIHLKNDIDILTEKLSNLIPNTIAVFIIDHEGLIVHSTAPGTEKIEMLAAFVRDAVKLISEMIVSFGARSIKTIVIRVNNYAFHIFPLEKIIGVAIAKRKT